MIEQDIHASDLGTLLGQAAREQASAAPRVENATARDRLQGYEAALRSHGIEPDPCLIVESDYKRALIGRWYEPTNLFGYIMVIYFGKIIVWDKVLKLGVTDGITGQGAEWAGWIMMFYVGKRGFENVARIIRK